MARYRYINTLFIKMKNTLFNSNNMPNKPLSPTYAHPKKASFISRTGLILMVLTLFFIMPANAQWRNYLSYSSPTEIEQASDGTLYVLASSGLYFYNPTDGQLITYDKTNGLNDASISHIAWNQKAQKLLIVYADNNIDLLSTNGNVTNMPAYKNTSMTEEKTINSISVSGSYAYLSTAFGIVSINMVNGEFHNTYKLGFNVSYSYIDGNYIYAASNTKGLYRGLLTANLVDPSNWTRTGDYVKKDKTIDPELLAKVSTLKPGGPTYNYFGFMRIINNQLYTCNGPYFNNTPASLQILNFDTREWTVFPNDSVYEKTGSRYWDLFALDVDPRNSNHIMAGGRSGLYEYLNGKFVNYYAKHNSLIQSFNNKSVNYQMVYGVKYDTDGNLWMLNSQAPTQSLIEYTADGQWISRSKPALMKLNQDGFTNKSLGILMDMKFDSRGLLWFVNNNWSTPSLYAYQISTDALNAYTSFVNEDGTAVEVNSVRCVTEDNDGNIWIGTTGGPLMLEPDQITAESPIFTQVKVPRNDGTNYADYLLSGVNVTSIAIDAANRKWIGTDGNGVYLISADNIHQLQHFTTENSPLLSDIIHAITVNTKTGEVFIGTESGLCSYTTASATTNEGMTKDNVYAYPNPVRPGYNGAITITGLEEDADVKIVTSSGALVYEGKSSNGEYRWYGLDRDGKRVASGVYMVEVATAAGEKGVVCKIAIVR